MGACTSFVHVLLKLRDRCAARGAGLPSAGACLMLHAFQRLLFEQQVVCEAQGVAVAGWSGMYLPCKQQSQPELGAIQAALELRITCASCVQASTAWF